ncbi:VWA domain-containing protein [Granulicella tundricola]|uniref:VWFA-related domain protein n=1 Tax=Granulicella tundricola (strain ATCC BAA-1859 / DSM 23138 / MP5ACTX9) TaxID=1198114 RepID=E8X4U4_GRATM|nr:VWA domain-containing protein [Granulicella tundricola]ADW70583.1 VWFA-related domain protein [Granulicella tundricola MP5ACTX9]
MGQTAPVATPPAQQTAPQQPVQAPPQEAPGATGLSARPQGQDQPFQLTVRANLVSLVFTVTDKKGRFVKDLHLSDFGLLDNGLQPEKVLDFKQQTDLPLRVGIMLDTSSSIRTRFKFEQDSAIDFFLSVMHQNDRAFVEGFDVQTYLPQDYTNNIDLLDQGIRKLRPGGGTALFDSLYKTCRDQMLALQADNEVRKALILVSDGDDNYSRASMTDAIKMCQRADTIVYTISTDTSPTRGKGGAVLESISGATGGRTFFPIKLEDVAIGFKNIEIELRSQYLLQYRPAEFTQDGKFRTILLRGANRAKDLTVRARTGYFAPRPPQ